jgi:glycosyltransferase involved in cell wall biosynthesis
MLNIFIDGIIYSKQSYGGINKYFNALIKKFITYPDVNVRVFCDKLGRKNLKINRGININEIFRFPIPGTVGRILNDRIYAYKIIRSIKKNNPAIFHSTYYTSMAKYSISEIVTVYDMIHELFPEYYSQSQRLIFNKKISILNAAAIIAVSNKTKEDLVNWYKLNPDKVHVIYPGIDSSYRIIGDYEKNKFIIKYGLKHPFVLYAGNRCSHKNFWGWLRFMKDWRGWNQNHFLCVGGGDFSESEFHQSQDKGWNPGEDWKDCGSRRTPRSIADDGHRN